MQLKNKTLESSRMEILNRNLSVDKKKEPQYKISKYLYIFFIFNLAILMYTIYQITSLTYTLSNMPWYNVTPYERIVNFLTNNTLLNYLLVLLNNNFNKKLLTHIIGTATTISYAKHTKYATDEILHNLACLINNLYGSTFRTSIYSCFFNIDHLQLFDIETKGTIKVLKKELIKIYDSNYTIIFNVINYLSNYQDSIVDTEKHLLYIRYVVNEFKKQNKINNLDVFLRQETHMLDDVSDPDLEDCLDIAKFVNLYIGEIVDLSGKSDTSKKLIKSITQNGLSAFVNDIISKDEKYSDEVISSKTHIALIQLSHIYNFISSLSSSTKRYFEEIFKSSDIIIAFRNEFSMNSAIYFSAIHNIHKHINSSAGIFGFNIKTSMNRSNKSAYDNLILNPLNESSDEEKKDIQNYINSAAYADPATLEGMLRKASVVAFINNVYTISSWNSILDMSNILHNIEKVIDQTDNTNKSTKFWLQNFQSIKSLHNVTAIKEFIKEFNDKIHDSKSIYGYTDVISMIKLFMNLS
jgi:hypothetical protein